jgi:hypothetical protein
MKYMLLSILTMVCGTTLFGQSSFIASYPISFPMGDLHTYSAKTSFRGINLEWLHEVKPGMAVGIETGWNVFYEKADKKDYKDGTTTISGTQFRYTNAVPILVETKYFPKASKKTAASYVGVGIGTLYVNRSTDFGLYRIITNDWQFCLRPEAGVVFQMQPGVKALLGVKYYAALNSSDLDGQSFISANIGFVFSSQ